MWDESREDQLSKPTTHSLLLTDVFTIKKSDLSVKWEKEYSPQIHPLTPPAIPQSLRIRAGSLTVDNTIKNDYLPYGNYRSRCVVHMDSTFAYVSIQAVEVSWIVVPMEISLRLDLISCLLRRAPTTTKSSVNAPGL